MTTFYYYSVNHQSGLQRNTSKCAANYVISFEVYDGFIGQKISKLWRQECWLFGPDWAANITIIRSWTFRLPCLKPKMPKKIYILFSTLILFPCKVNFLIKRLISPCAAAPAGHSQACWTFQDLHTGPTFQTLKMTSRKAKKSVLNKIS